MTDRPAFNPAAFKDVGAINKEEVPLVDSGAAFNPAAVLDAIDNRVEKVEQEKKDLRELPLGPVPRWSFSALMTFEKCPLQVKLSKVDGCPDPSGPAADRGSRLHTAIEDYVEGREAELDKEVKHFRDLIDGMRDRYADGRVYVEGEWAFDRKWEIVPYNSERAWTRGKLDVLEYESDTAAWIVDWKSGRKFGNEMKHGQQLQLYAIYTFLRDPNLEFIKAEMIYIDKGERMTQTYTRQQALQFMDRWDERGNQMTTCTVFRPRASIYSCKWCPHAKTQDGRTEPACPYRAEV